MSTSRVTIGLPVHDGAALLPDALDSLLAQTHEDFELLISDNASTDDTPEIAADYAARDERVQWWRFSENRGAAFNYNHVFSRARGALFKWASHDDLCAPTFLARCIEALDEGGPEVVLAYPRTMLIDLEGNELEPFDDRLDLRSPHPARRLRDYALRWRLANALFGVVRASTLARTHLVQPYVSSDLTLIAELALRGAFHEVPDRLFSRRIHPDSSRRGTLSLDAVATWFDPGRRRAPVVPPLVRVWASTIRSIAVADDVPVARRMVCAGVYAESWVEKRTRARVGRMRRDRRRTRPSDRVGQVAGPPAV
jgi:glycosyltransferase involved in cell wall biosynthesis